MMDTKLPRHKFWGAGEQDCPPELKAPNGELHTMRCKVCGDGWRKSNNVCLAALGSLAADANDEDPHVMSALNAGVPRGADSLSESHEWWTALAAEGKDIRRYRALRELGVAPADWPGLEQGNVLRFTNLDEHADALLKRRPADATPPRAVQPPEFQEVSWGVDAVMRPVKGMAVSEYAFRQWAKDVGIVLAAGVSVLEPQQQEGGN